MSGSGTKKVVETAVKSAKAIDWDALAKVLVNGEARKEFSKLRRTCKRALKQLRTNCSEEPEPIDWEYYRKEVGTRLVDMYKEDYDSIEIPKRVDPPVTSKYKPIFDVMMAELKEAEREALKEIEKMKKESAEEMKNKNKEYDR